MEYAVAFDAEGKREFVAPHFIGSGEVLQAKALIRGAISRGSKESNTSCAAWLGRLRSDDSSVVELRLVRGTHDSVAYLQGDLSKSNERTLVACKK